MEKFLTKRLFIVAFVIMMGSVVFGQQIMVSGTVTDATDRSGLPGVNVQIKGTFTGTATDLDGKYSISAKTGDILVFSFIGYLSQEIPVGGQGIIDVALITDVKALEEVVVIGYGTVKKADATGSVSAISSEDFNKGAITSAQDLLVGKSAGVVITTAGGAPGSGSTIRIRGGSSLNASNDPLVIIDGVPISNGTVSGSSNFLSFLNPNDIETFTVLKDASSAAIYGARASNGVILITTKKGTLGSKMKVTYDGNTSFANAIEFIDVYSGDELRQIAFDHSELYSPETYTYLGAENTDWQGEIFRTAVSHDHNLSLSGSYETLPYRLSIGYTNQNGIMKNTDLERYTGALNLDPSFFNGALKVSINLKGMRTNHNFGDSGALGSAVNMDPTQAIMDGNAATAGYYQWSSYGANLGTPNPVEQLMEINNRSVVYRFIGNAQFTLQIPYVRGLIANLNLATDYTGSKGYNNRPKTSPSTLTGDYWGHLSNYWGKGYNDLLDFYFNYKTELPGINSTLDAIAGYSWQHFKSKSDSYTRGFYDASHPYLSRFDPNATENYLISFFGRVNYTLMDKYLVTVNLRRDGSSRFLEHWGTFPSVALGWKLKEETFLKNVNAVSSLKLRLGWGITGQQDITDNDYPAMALYEEASMGSYYMIDGEYIPTLRPKAYDPHIKWEETTTTNIGIDFGFLDDRITGSFDVYNRVTDDLLNLVTIPSGSNFSNKLYTNVGSLENKGAELSLNLIPISKQDMTLEIGLNFTYNKNEITKLLLSDDPEYIGVLYGDAFTGEKQVTRVGYAAKSFFVNKQIYDQNDNPIEGLYADLSGQGGTVNGDNEDKYIYHNPVPDYLIGLSARFSYKKFDLSASSRASIGNYVYNQVAAGASYDQMQQIGYWKNFTKALSETNFVKRQFTSDYFVENGSFFKLDNVSAGYRFENISGSKMNARVSFTVQNALTVTKYTGLDPEVPDGIDNNFYPRPRTFMIGLSLSY